MTVADNDRRQQSDAEVNPPPPGGEPGELAGDGVFRWPSSGLPRGFGQPLARLSPEGQPPPSAAPGSEPYPGAPGWRAVPFPPRLTLTPQPPYPEPSPQAPYPLPDDYDAIDDYDAADAYGPADGYEPGYGGFGDGGQGAEPAADGGEAPRGAEAGPAAGTGGPLAPPSAAADDLGNEQAADRASGPADPAARRPAPASETAAAAATARRPADPPQAAETADSLTSDLLLPGRQPVPAGGWRRLLYRGSGGLIRLPESAAEQRRRQLVARACTPVAGGHQRVAVLSLKGGVGKTTTAVGLGATLASLRGDRVIAVDANPDRGTLSDKLRLETAATVRDLLSERAQIRRYADVRAFTTQAPSRLEVLASDRDPTVSVAFSDADYIDVAAVLEHYYSICITDCGTGLLHSAMAGVLKLADQIVLVSSPSVDGARSASATLDWLAAHHYGDLVRRGVVVLSAVRPRGKSTVDIGRLEAHFAARCRAVVRIPYDPHLAEGAELDLGQLSRETADAYLALAAEVGDGFARLRQAPA